MQTLLAILAAEATTNPAETWYSPGVIGFIATFGVTAAAVALIFDMVRRVRRVRYRAEIQAKLDAEQSQKSAPSESKPAESKAKAAPAAKAATTKPAAPAPAARAKPARPAPPKKPSRD
jgi:pyruvate/2-oxoglutarate dehydrogenase complex dihydrolipoamide acyltransferase (E2) component